MSADAWRVCPVCKGSDPHCWESLLGEGEPKETLREDYEQYMDEEGVYHCDYHCRCTECGFKWSFKHNVRAIEQRNEP